MKYSAGLIPIDYRILKEMTKEGTELAEFIPLGPSTKALAKRIEGITSNQVAGRIQTLERIGMCVSIPLLPASAGRGFQRTPKGDDFLQDVDDLGVIAALEKVNATINDEHVGPRHGGAQPVIRQEKETPPVSAAELFSPHSYEEDEEL